MKEEEQDCRLKMKQPEIVRVCQQKQNSNLISIIFGSIMQRTNAA